MWQQHYAPAYRTVTYRPRTLHKNNTMSNWKPLGGRADRTPLVRALTISQSCGGIRTITGFKTITAVARRSPDSSDARIYQVGLVFLSRDTAFKFPQRCRPSYAIARPSTHRQLGDKSGPRLVRSLRNGSCGG